MKKELLKQSHHVLISVTRTQTTGVSEPGGPGGAEINQPYLNQGKGADYAHHIALLFDLLPHPTGFSDLPTALDQKKICGGHVIPSFI